WTAKNGRIGGERPGTASYPRHTSGVRDQYEDGYPPSIREAMRIEGVVQGPGLNGVGDLRLETQLTAASDTTEVQIKLTEDQRHYTFSFPGPAADGSARCTVTTPTGEVFTAESAFQLTSASMDVAIENIDDLLRLEVDGEILVEVEVAPVIGNEGGRLRLASLGGGAIFDHVRVLRDIYYTSKGYKRSTWEIPDESYVMLGDNTLNSSDGRDWAFANFSVPVGDERVTIRGNSRRQAPAPGLIPRGAGNSQAGEHPYVVRRTGEPDQVFLHDEWGDRWVFDSPPAQDLGDEDFPFVHRSLIQGRAVMVVWPLSPGRGIYRIQWVR
ncbi:MAG: hypothetical protein O2816_18510, partial [Planctomycetota bacterium]|nr:hypothetical protein [Planctomycetota bacterium]